MHRRRFPSLAWRCAALLGIALTTAPSVSRAQPAAERTPAPKELARSWLLRDCELGAADVEKSMREHEDRLSDLFLAAFHDGPPDALAAGVERNARAHFTLRRRALEHPKPWLPSHVDLGRVAALSEAEYVARELERLRLRYRSQALRGLLVVRPDLARRLLAEQAGDARSPLRDVAARLLERQPPD
jgi:hypothetical protein